MRVEMWESVLWFSTFPHAFVLEATDARDTAVAEAGRPSIRVFW
jgi:hypothetical protein